MRGSRDPRKAKQEITRRVDRPQGGRSDSGGVGWRKAWVRPAMSGDVISALNEGN